MTIQVLLGYAPRPDHHDAILTFTEHLASALSDRPDVVAGLVLRRKVGAWNPMATPGEVSLHEALRRTGSSEFVLQYNPFSYGHWGVAPGLVMELLMARRRGSLRRLVLVVHEPYVIMPGLRYTLMGAVQRCQLAALLRLADAVVATTERWIPALTSFKPRSRVVVVPVSSNMPDERAARASARQQLGARTGSLILTTFGMAGPQQLVGHAAHALELTLADGHETILVHLGYAPEALAIRHPRLTVVRPGSQNAPDLARMLAASDVFLAPYADGVSTRRTTLMAALQHGLCVVTTAGRRPHPVLREPAMRSIPLADGAGFAETVRALARDGTERARIGQAGRKLYDRCYSWDAIATKYMSAICPPTNGPATAAQSHLDQ